MSHKETLRLPQSSFPLRVAPGEQEAAILARWDERDLYAQRQRKWADAPVLSLHDGPPYTYHKPQLRNAFNKILKDIWGRAGHLLGYRCDYVPGWDCHALPVAREVEARLGEEKDQLSPVAFREACREYVRDSIALQRDLFARLGVLADWQSAYKTMSPSYEAAVMRALAKMVRADALVWRHQPVHWCGECETALASFEIRYRKISSPSLFVGYPLISDPMRIDRALRGRDVEVVVWTASPWRLPGNQGIGVHKDADYVAVRVQRRIYILAEASLESVAKACGWGNDVDIAVKVTGQQLLGLRCRHPLLHRELPVLASDRVEPEVGSGCVQIAPGHNINDFALAQEAELELYSPIDERGCFSPQLTAWAGMHFSEITDKLLRQLQEWGSLLNSPRHEIEHHAPHCRRCGQRTCQRTAPMWFMSMSRNDLRTKVLDAAQRVEWEPSWMSQQMTQQLKERGDWCLSRSRSWGIPLPVFYCKRCDRPWLHASMIDAVAELFAQHPNGADAWYERSVEELLDDADLSPRCPRCFLKSFRKESDVLDLWWEAGISFLTRGDDAEEGATPFDLYMEGTEQVESWFQSALLASTLLHGEAPYKKVHGHAKVARKPRQLTPEEAERWAPAALLERYGADVLRIWVVVESHQHQRPVNADRLEQYAHQYQKLRGLCRFLLGNVTDLSPEQRVSPNDFEPFEQLGMVRLQALVKACHEAYAEGRYHRVWHEVMQFAGRDLSRFACEVLKERLYCESANATVRRSAQSFLYQCANTIAVLIAPICCYLAEEIWMALHEETLDHAETTSWSVHLSSWSALPSEEHWAPTASWMVPYAWEQLRQLRALAQKRRRQQHPKKGAGASLALDISMCDGHAALALLDGLSRDVLAEVAGATEVTFANESDAKGAENSDAAQDLGAASHENGQMPVVRRPLHETLALTWTVLDEKSCPRCRRLSGQNEHHAAYCQRCAQVVDEAS